MLGAGLIKLRGDPCWTELTCLEPLRDQPIPNPVSYFTTSRPSSCAPASSTTTSPSSSVQVRVHGPRRSADPRHPRHDRVSADHSSSAATSPSSTGSPSSRCSLCLDDAFLRRLHPRAWTARAGDGTAPATRAATITPPATPSSYCGSASTSSPTWPGGASR